MIRIGKTGNAFNRKPDIFFFLLHGASTSIYKIIKNVCEVKLGVASQVMLVEKAFNLKGQLQYLGNIGLKVNAKVCIVLSIQALNRLQSSFFISSVVQIAVSVSHSSSGLAI